ncbi:MAG TPA: GIY-YIG nuclease family protein [Rhizomicrobium sp.]|nr:GIY-YIG nuclease family protein [Rhizomicrobium sp.]
MDNARKKELLREYRETRQRAGVFAVRCGDARWIGTTRNLDKQRNSLWFQLRMNGFPNNDVQAIWNAQGEAGFVYEELEEVTDENALLIDELLKERAAHWRKAWGAAKILG